MSFYTKYTHTHMTIHTYISQCQLNHIQPQQNPEQNFDPNVLIISFTTTKLILL